MDRRSAAGRDGRLDYCYQFMLCASVEVLDASSGAGIESILDIRTMALKRKSKKSGWGGRRPGAGRPKGSGTGPSPGARINRVVAMLSNDELKVLKRIARRKKLPVGTVAYQMIARALKRNG